MAKFNTATNRPMKAGKPVLKASSVATHRTFEGGDAYLRDDKSELYILGVSLFANDKDTFYESAKIRDDRFNNLVETLAVYDPAWTLGFLHWLRSEGNIRTASVMGTVHAIHARLQANLATEGDGPTWNRQFAAIVPQRLDEVPEEFAIWRAQFPGTPIPSALKRGAGDALGRLLNEYSYMKYGRSDNANWQVADVLEMAHVKPANADLAKLALSERHDNAFDLNPETLPMIAANKALRKAAASDPSVLLDPVALKAAGMTWEDVLSLAGNKLPKNKIWEALILGDSMGIFALLRNLRNFTDAGISREATDLVIAKLTSEEVIRKSRLFPFRFLTAYENARGSVWAHPLEVALELSTPNIPVLDGKNDVLIDVSGSMSGEWKKRAALFGLSFASRNPGSTDVYVFANNTAKLTVRKGDSVLRHAEGVGKGNHPNVGGGTATAHAVQSTFRDHDRIFIFTDEQSFGASRGYYSGDVSGAAPDSVHMYAFNLGGYKGSMLPAGNGRRYQLGGLTDQTFKLPVLLERGNTDKWPWEK